MFFKRVNGKSQVMKIFAKLLGILVVIIATIVTIFLLKPEKKKNVLLITLDGLRRDHISYFGYNKKTTPNIDFLAENGFVFDNVIPSGTETPHSLTSLFTSIDYRYHHISQQVLHHLPDEFYTLAESFFDQGYITAGITANPVLAKSKNFDQGFMIYDDFSDDIDDLLSFKTLMTAEIVGKRSLAFLERYATGERKLPFFLYIHFMEPHPPWFHEYTEEGVKQIDETFPLDRGCFYIPKDDIYQSTVTSGEKEKIISMYDGAVFSADREIGKIVDKLKAIDELENTIIAVSSDHGYELLDRYAVTHGMNPFDEVTKLFLVLFDENQRKADWMNSKDLEKIQARIFDIGPTLMGLVGLERHQNWEGLDLFEESESLPEYAFTQGAYVCAVRKKRFKLVYINLEPMNELKGTAYQFWTFGEYKMPAYIKEYGFMLFDLENDPKETIDVKDKYPEIFQELQLEFEKYQKDVKREFALGTTNAIDEEVLKRLKSLGYVK